jgi:3-methyladenine DNA glycosylase AlkD
MESLIADLQDRLDAAAEPARKAWWESYLKGAIGFRGADMAGIRRAVHAWYADHDLGARTPAGQKSLAWALLREAIAEDKLAGILVLQEILLPAGLLDCGDDLASIASLFDDGSIADWNTCDWLCVRVLGPLAERNGERCARAISAWSTAGNLWRRRAAGVAFVNQAGRPHEPFTGFRAMLLDVCDATVRSDERFAQTGTGWVLRELSKADPAAVERFVADHLESMSGEGLRYATARLDDTTRRGLADRHRWRRAR